MEFDAGKSADDVAVSDLSSGRSEITHPTWVGIFNLLHFNSGLAAFVGDSCSRNVKCDNVRFFNRPVRVKHVHTIHHCCVDVARGLADIFFRGMDTLTEKLNRQGYSARTYSTNGWRTVAQQTATRYFRGHKDVIVIVGHSLGANATFDVANYLDQHNIPIELIVTFDATDSRPVPKNVQHLVNFYQQNGFGRKVVAGPDFKGELSNVDLTADTTRALIPMMARAMLQSEAGYIDARPLTAASSKSLATHARTIH